MQYIRTFESFDQSMSGREKPETFILFVRSAEGEDLEGDVQDPDGKVVLELGQSMIDDGVMQHAADVSGLREYMISKKKMRQQDELVPDGGMVGKLGREMQSSSGHNPMQMTIPVV